MAANEFKRKRIYYTKAQITNGLLTDGKEWMFEDTTEYIGQYHKYTTGEVFSEPTFIDGKSRKLIPYVDVQSIGIENLDGMDLAKSFLYDNIKKVKVKKMVLPNSSVEPIKDEDLVNGYMERFFGYRYDNDCLELNKENFNKIGSEEGLSSVVYLKVKLKWKITGPISDIKDDKGNILEPGVFDTNKRTVALYSEKYPMLKQKLMDYTEFYQP